MTRLNDFSAHTWDETPRARPTGFPLDCLHAGRLEVYRHSRLSHFVTFACYHRLPQLNTGEIRDVVVRRWSMRVRIPAEADHRSCLIAITIPA